MFPIQRNCAMTATILSIRYLFIYFFVLVVAPNWRQLLVGANWSKWCWTCPCFLKENYYKFWTYSHLHPMRSSFLMGGGQIANCKEEMEWIKGRRDIFSSAFLIYLLDLERYSL